MEDIQQPPQPKSPIAAIAIGVIAALLLGGLAYVMLRPSPVQAPATTISTTPPTPSTPTPAPVPSVPAQPVVIPTSTPSTAEATSTPPVPPDGSQEPQVFHLGDTAQFFLNNDYRFEDQRDPKRAFAITVAEFTDSRCPQGVVCVWQGELGVRLHVTDTRSGQTQDVMLGMVRAKTASALGLRFTLRDIDEGKGGTYADITIQ